jgi:hypothetical protein
MNHLSEEQLILHYYGEAEPGGGEAHLDECPECRSAYQSLQRVLNSLDSAPVPERGPDYGRQVWQAVRRQGEPRRSWPRPAFLAAMAAAILIGAFLAGSAYERARTPAPAAVAVVDDPTPRLLRVALDGHLASSLMVLSEIQNAPAGAMDISWQQQHAEQLLGDNRIYKQTAENAQEARLGQLLAGLEEILLEIAHSPTKLTSAQRNSLRARIASKGIVFEIRILAAEPATEKGNL